MDYVGAVIDEIALEGLDGITLTMLWKRLEQREPHFSLKIDEQCKEYLWSSVISRHDSLSFFELETARSDLAPVNRRRFTDPDTGTIGEEQNKNEDLVNVYPFKLVSDKEHGIVGSCSSYTMRRNVTDDVRSANGLLTVAAVHQRWGIDKFVIVASQRLRCLALCGPDKVDIVQFNDMQYCILERIGCSRHYGQVTAGGDGSLRELVPSAKGLFYIRKLLKQQHLIKSQPAGLLKQHGGVAQCQLVHLPRFFERLYSKRGEQLRTLTTKLAALPQQIGIAKDLRTQLDMTANSFRKLCYSAGSYVKFDVVPYRSLYPDASEKEFMTMLKCERQLTIVRLIKLYQCDTDGVTACDTDGVTACDTDGVMADSDTDSDRDDSADDDNSDDDNTSENLSALESAVEWFSAPAVNDDVRSSSRKQVVCETPLLKQAHDQLDVAGKAGLTIAELSRQLGLQRYDGRMLLRNLSRKGLTVYTEHNQCKSIIGRYMLRQYDASELKKTFSGCGFDCAADDVPSLQKLDLADLPDVVTSDSAKVVIQPKDEDIPCTSVSGPKVWDTSRSARRREIILEMLRSEPVIYEPVSIFQKIRVKEKEVETVTICRKTMMRLLEHMHNKRLLNCIYKTLAMPDGSERKLLFVTDVTIAEDDERVDRAFHYVSQNLLTKAKKNTINSSESAKKQDADTPESLGMVYDQLAGVQHGFLPCMTRRAVLHEVLWWMVYGGRPEDLSSAAVQNNADFLSIICGGTSSWHSYVPRLTKHPVYPEGWQCLRDITMNLPLSVYCQIHRFNYKVSSMNEYLEDQQRCHMVISELPKQLRQCLLYGRTFIYTLHQLCISLSKLGLLSFAKSENRIKEELIVYIHRQASIVETSQCGMPRQEMPVCRFTFNSLAEVRAFWTTLQRESFNTAAENFVFCKKSCDDEDCSQGKTVDEVVDDGHIPGDGLGACGFDSSLYLCRPPSWNLRYGKSNISSLIFKDAKKHQDEVVQVRKRGRKRKQCGPVAGGEKPAQTVTVKDLPRRGGYSRGRARGHRFRSLHVSQELKSDQKPVTERNRYAERRKIKLKQSEKDAAAMSLMQRMRVIWSSDEDSLLLLCQVVGQFLVGQRDFQSWIPPYVVRDIMHENFTSSCDKSSKACTRRIMHMMKNPETVQNVNLYLNEAQTDKELVDEFKTGKEYVRANVEEPFRRCLQKLRVKFRGFATEPELVELKLPDSVEQLHRQFCLHKASGNDEQFRAAKLDTADDVYLSVLQNLIMSSMLTCDKTSRAHELHEVCRSYPEPVLTAAFESLKRGGIVANHKLTLAKTPSTVMFGSTIGHYKLSQRYQFVWKSLYPESIFDDAHGLLQQFELETSVCDTGDSDVAVSSLLTLGDTPASAIVAVTLTALRKLVFETTVPEEVIVVKSLNGKQKYKKKTVEANGDSDEEAQQLIDEAENEEENETSAFTGTSGTRLSRRWSRAKLTMNKCQYTHSYSLRFLQASDNVLINSCTVKIRLVDDVFLQRSTQVSSADHRKLKTVHEWNQHQLLLHPRTCLEIRKLIRKEVPNHVDVIMAAPTQSCHTSGGNHDMQTVQHFNSLQIVYNEVASAGFLGKTLFELQSSLKDVDPSLIRRIVSSLCDICALMRVGVDEFRYVATSAAICWLITTDKNIKGRGYRPFDNQGAVVVDLNTVKIQDEDVQIANTVSLVHEVKSSEDAVRLPQSRIIMATAKPLPVKASEAARQKSVAVPVTTSSTLKRKRMASSSTHLLEPRSKHLRRDQKFKRETTSADWTESLFVSEMSEAGREVAEVVSVADTEELKAAPLSVASSDMISVPLVSESGQFETAVLKKLPQQNSVHCTNLPSEVITAVSSDSGKTLIQRDGVYPGAVTVDAAEKYQSNDATSSLLNADLLKSPPSVQHTLLTDLPGRPLVRSPSTAVQTVRTSLPMSSAPSSEAMSCPSSASKTMFSVPVHSSSGYVSATSVYQIRLASNASKMHTATDGLNFGVKQAASTSAEQQRSHSTLVSVLSRIPSQSQSSVQSRPSVGSCLSSSSKSMMCAVVSTQNSSPRHDCVLIRGQQFKQLSCRPSDVLERLTAFSVGQQRPSVSVPVAQRCSASVAGKQQMLSPVIGRLDSHHSPSAVPTRPRLVPPQPVRIRVNASDLGNSDDPTAVMNHVYGILSRTNTVLPGAKIRIHYMPPQTTSSQMVTARPSFTPQTTTSEHVSTTVSQLDGTADSDDDSETADAIQDESTTSTSTSIGIENVSTVCTKRRLKAADADNKPGSDSRVSTYKVVKLLPRPWKTPEGTVNHVSFRTLLTGVMMHIMENPGITRDKLVQKYAKYLQPVPLFELIEMLEDIACVYSSSIRCGHKPSLFSSRSSVVEVTGNSACETSPRETAVYFPTVDCILKLGQFIDQLQSGLRTIS